MGVKFLFASVTFLRVGSTLVVDTEFIFLNILEESLSRTVGGYSQTTSVGVFLGSSTNIRYFKQKVYNVIRVI